MKKILLIIALFTSYTINASTLVFSNNLIIEETSYLGSTHGAHGEGDETLFGIKATFNDAEYTGIMEHGYYISFSNTGSYLTQNQDSIVFATKFLDISFGDGNHAWSLSGEETRENTLDSSFGIYDIKDFELKFYDYPNPFANGNLNPEPTSIETITLIPVAETPIPAAIWLFGAGLIGLFKLSARRQNSFKGNAYS
jgi:hypothetical protein